MMRKSVNELSLVRDATRVAYLACRPRPLSIILWIGGTTKTGTGRFPTPAELRTMAYYAVGEGAKGISYFGYEPGSWAGCKENAALWAAIGDLNRDLHVVGPVVSRAHPMSIAKGSHENLWVRALVQGDENVVVVVANDSYRSSSDGFTQDTIRGASIHVDPPAGMTIRKAFRVRKGSAQPTEFATSGLGVEVPLGDVTAGALLLLTAGDAPPEPDRMELAPELRAWIEEVGATRQAARKQTDSDLVALYHFDEGKGRVAKDSSLFGNDGGVNGAKWVPGRSGQALHFDGAGHYVEVLHSDSLNPRAALTIEAWIKTAENSSHKIVSKPESYVLSVWGTKLVGRVILQEELKPKAIYRTLQGRPDTLVPGKWYHLAMTYDSATGELVTYVDGKWESRGVVGNRKDNRLAATSRAMHIGGSPWYGTYSKTVIDEVRIYRRALTAAEVKSHYEDSEAGN